jgi:hypothetical protein
MKLETQVASFEQSKKLKELGVVQDANFFWGKDLTKSTTKMMLYSKNDILLNMALIDKYIVPKLNLNIWLKEKNLFAAFTVAELGIMLPEYYPSWRFTFKKAKKWLSTVIIKDKVKDGKTVTTANEFDRYADTEAQARAIILIDLLKNEVINVKDVNNRLIKK